MFQYQKLSAHDEADYSINGFNSRQSTRLTSDDYIVACIVPLGVELAPLRAMLDSIHEDLPIRRSQNAYILGDIGHHNVVVAVLPAVGNNDSGVVANQLLNDFPSIKFGLLVGIAGGVPGINGRNDVRLGDVVVSEPNGTNGGVLQFDRGKVHGLNNFELVGHLNQPPTLLIATVKKLKAQHMQEGSHIQMILSQFLQSNPEMERQFTRPNSENDQLFESDYRHVGGNDCQTCDLNKIIKRSVRTSNIPVIHYGTIGSSNAVIRDAIERDRLGSQYGLLAIEMEAAGLMNTLPCLVIRGICDYADSHKHKAWQPHAAAVAAAYVRMLLQAVSPTNIPSPVQSREFDQKYDMLIKKLARSLHFEGINARQHNIDDPLIGTCRWIFDNAEFQYWADRSDFANNRGFLWIKGKPGCGKSTIMKTTVQWATEKWSQEINIPYFFNARSPNDLERSSLGFYRSALTQLLSECSHRAPNILRQWVRTLRGDIVRDWTLSELRGYLKQLVLSLHGQSLNIFVDALDEGGEDDVRQLILFLEDLTMHAQRLNPGDGSRLRLCVSSRHFPHISIQNGLFVTVDGQPGHRADIGIFIAARMSYAHSTELKILRDEIYVKSNGVFVWLVLVLPILHKVHDRYRSISRMLEQLQVLPSELDKLFTEVLAQDTDDIQECLLLLQLVLYASLITNVDGISHENLKQLCFAYLRAYPVSRQWKRKGQEFSSKLDSVTQIPNLTNHAVQNLFWHAESAAMHGISQRQFLARIQRADYQRFCEWLPHQDLFDLATRYQTREIELLPYRSLTLQSKRSRSRFGGTIGKYETNDHTTFDLAEDHLLFFLTEHHYMALVQTLLKDGADPNMNVEPYGTILQFASAYSSDEVVTYLLDSGARVDTQGGRFGNALQAACAYSRTKTILLLLTRGADINSRAGLLETALQSAVIRRDEKLVEFLLEHGADANTLSVKHESVLRAACKYSTFNVIRSLLACGADVNAHSNAYGTVLRDVCTCCNPDLIRLLLDHRADVNLRSLGHDNALETACHNGDVEIVKVLLRYGADVNSHGGPHGTPLRNAVRTGNTSLVRLLFEHVAGADVGYHRDDLGDALQAACLENNRKMMRLLIKRGADPNFQDNLGWSVLATACHVSSIRTVRALLRHGARANDRGALACVRANGRLDLKGLLLRQCPGLRDIGPDSTMTASETNDTELVARSNQHCQQNLLCPRDKSNFFGEPEQVVRYEIGILCELPSERSVVDIMRDAFDPEIPWWHIHHEVDTPGKKVTSQFEKLYAETGLSDSE